MPWLSSTAPRPPQAEHITGEVPGDTATQESLMVLATQRDAAVATVH